MLGVMARAQLSHGIITTGSKDLGIWSGIRDLNPTSDRGTVGAHSELCRIDYFACFEECLLQLWRGIIELLLVLPHAVVPVLTKLRHVVVHRILKRTHIADNPHGVWGQNRVDKS